MADTLDILTLAEGKTAVNIPTANTDHDTELAMLITAVSRIIDAEVGPVVNRTVTAEIHDGGGPLWVRQYPLVSVSLVREAAGGTTTTHSAVTFGQNTDGYMIDQTLNGRILRAYGGRPDQWSADSLVEVTYVAGRAANTAAVDPRFKSCAAAILRRLWKRESGTWAQTPAFFEGEVGEVTDIGFYRVAKPVIDDMLSDQVRMPGQG